MHAIILAAGQGTRLRPYTDHVPKGMVKLNGIPLLLRQKEVLNIVGVDNVNVVTGYKEECIDISGIQKFYNPLYASTNMVASLYCAKELFNGSSDIIISYGDIVYEQKVITKLINCKNDLSVVIDKGWLALWEIRMENILEDAETLKINQEGNIVEIGKKPKSQADIQGQYIGLIKVSKEFAPSFFQLYEKLKGKPGLYDGKDYDNMYMTTYLQLLINHSKKIKAVMINNGWLEVDTTEDLETYEKLIANGQLDSIYKL
ncbi:MAG: sugar nucleotidyltransferase [Saprospiraceae bacterium]|nr:MAG: sugar nucleotidyltransferase [Saprospiraceae bacterium]